MVDLSRYGQNGTFNVNDVEPDEYEIINPGIYTVMINETKEKPTSKGGSMVVFEFQILGSQYDGRKLFENLNINNQNETAVKIAFQTLAKIVKACGLEQITDTAALHGKRLKIEVDVEKGVGTYTDKFGTEKPRADQNKIKKYMSLNESAAPRAPSATAPAPAQQTEQAAPVQSARPWA